MQPKWEVADVLRHVNTEAFTIHQQKTLRAIVQCRTPALGGHVDVCDACGVIHISYNSCRNRHCPKCQGHKREEWIAKREQDLLPCTYYHLVFTLPQKLNPVALNKTEITYRGLFTAAWNTLQQFSNREGILLGMIAVLHTWGQNLSLHPHLHCIVAGGGIDKNGKWKKQIRSNKYLFSVKALSKIIRSVQQRFHFLPFGQNENLVIGCTHFLEKLQYFLISPVISLFKKTIYLIPMASLSPTYHRRNYFGFIIVHFYELQDFLQILIFFFSFWWESIIQIHF